LSPDSHAGSPADPQSWNRYAYTEGNPQSYLDADGHVVTYATKGVEAYTGREAALNPEVQATLDLYAGSLNLFITAGSVGNTREGQKEAGEFSVTADMNTVEYTGNYDNLKSDADLCPANCDFVTSIKFKNDATITIGPDAKEEDFLHELGHADQFAHNPLQFVKDQSEKATKGKEHDKQPAEIYANNYAGRQKHRTKAKPFDIRAFYERFDEFLGFSTAYIYGNLQLLYPPM
jgi:hypothetical protein